MSEPDPPDASDNGPPSQQLTRADAVSPIEAVTALKDLDVDLVMSDGSSELSDIPDLNMDGDDDNSSLSSLPSDDEDMSDKKLNITPGVMRTTRNKRPLLLPAGSSDDSDDGSDYEKPKTKKAKKSSSKIRQKKKTGKYRSPVRGGKKKGNIAQLSDDERDKVVKKGKVRKPLLAEAAVWDDIPDWGDRTDCPLFQLPVEMLDMIFAPSSSGLGLRDYVSLAGVSRAFRLRLTSTVFQAAASALKILGAADDAKIRRIDLSQADRIFSREVEDTRVNPEPACPPAITHYIPVGPRADWSQAQYIVYKEERGRWKVKERERKRREAKIAADTAAQRRSLLKHIQVGGRGKRVLATIEGRADGEAPVYNNADGLPLVNGAVVKVEKPVSSTSADVEHDKIPKSASREPSGSQANADDIGGRVYDPAINISWVVPDTDDDDEEEEPQVQWTWSGEQVFFDHYPNRWRTRAVETIEDENLTKRMAMTKYKVTEAELLCLRHHLIKSPGNKKSPQLIFSEAAVEALAFRSHGGPIGHAMYVQAIDKKTKEAAEARTARAAAKILSGLKPSVQH